VHRGHRSAILGRIGVRLLFGPDEATVSRIFSIIRVDETRIRGCGGKKIADEKINRPLIHLSIHFSHSLGRSWCKFLHSVEYLGLADDGRGNGGIVNGDGDDDACTPLRESRWTVGVRGLRFR
jgi:hypothetical protein